MVDDPQFMATVSNEPGEWRRLLEMLTNGRAGVYPRIGGLKVTQRAAGTNMSVDVAKGGAAILGTEDANQGSYGQRITSVTNKVVAASNSSNPRKDIVVLQIKDGEYPSGSTGPVYTGTLEVLTGTAAGSPVDPTLPDNCIPLARITVPAAASSITNAMITDLRVPLFPVYRARAYRSTALTMAAGTNVVPFNTADFDSGSNLENLGGSSAGFRCPADTEYDLKFRMNWTLNNNVQNAALYILKNSSLVAARRMTFRPDLGAPPITADTQSLELNDCLRCDEGDLLQAAFSFGGNSLVITTGITESIFAVRAV